jgi:hypothetical protein
VFPLEEPVKRLDPGAQLFDLRETFTPEGSSQLVAAAETEAKCERIGGADAAAGDVE